MLSFDFEDGVLPAAFTAGALAPGPGRPAGTYAVMGTLDFYGPAYSTVAVGPGRDLFRYAPSLVLGFDYWLGADTHDLVVQVWCSDRGQNYALPLGELPSETWANAQVPLGSLRGKTRAGVPMEDGDRISNIMIYGGHMPGQPLYIDNLRLMDHPVALGAAPR